MARKANPTLTEAELRLMDVVWELGQASVSEVHEALPAVHRPPYNTILTTMRILEVKGYLERAKEGRAHIYRPLVTRRQARRSAVRHMVSSFFNGSPELLMLSILEDEKLTAAYLQRLKQMIRENEQV